MLAVMSKKKQTAPVEPKQSRGPVLYMRMPDELEAALQSFNASQLIPPDRTAVGLAALERFLREHGYYPAKK